MKKRHKAQSGIITAILLIVVVIVSVVIVFNVVYGIIKKNTSGAENTDMLTSSLEIKQTKLYVTGGAQVTVYRPAGEGTITSLKFIFESKDGEKKIITRVENITELAQKNFVFTNAEIGYNNSDIKAIYVAPIYGTKTGKEIAESSTSYNKDNNGNRVYDVKADSGLISWWKFDGNMKDSIGGNDGSCTSCPTSGNDNKGNINMAYCFDGTNNLINFGKANSLPITSQITISFWFKPTSLPSNNTIPLGKDYAYRLVLSGGSSGAGAHFIVNTTNTVWYSAGTAADNYVAMTANNWYMFTGVYDGSSVKIYRNGDLAGTGSQPISGNILPNNFNLTSGVVNPSGGVAGCIDNAMIFNKSLSAEEIANLYNSQK